MGYKTDYARVNGLGTAHEGAHHWWQQRVSSIAMLVLAALFLLPFARALGGGYEAMIATYQNWWNALVAVLTVITIFWHARLGLQVVIEDYLPHNPARTIALLLNTLLTWGFAAAGVFAIAKIAFSA